ncbi:type VII secretion protein EccE [Mycobacteroides abscessus]|uniref:type VII secretion protein EccE n=1 Tax=Mycobacteroides abscessus TaxID=36809 RepID=UPI00092684AF|nr:type VII secretion protein EccE [Mycobacteroides abscessus]SIC20482.1 type VII secretion protein EccE [Mycobacteroides abscessus subsp. abscessus]
MAAGKSHRSSTPRVWGIDKRWRNAIPVVVIVAIIATAPVPVRVGWLAGQAAAAVLVVIFGMITLGGFTVPQWVWERVTVAWGHWRYKTPEQQGVEAALARHIKGQDVMAAYKAAGVPLPDPRENLALEASARTMAAGDLAVIGNSYAPLLSPSVVFLDGGERSTEDLAEIDGFRGFFRAPTEYHRVVIGGQEYGVRYVDGQLICVLAIDGRSQVAHWLRGRQVDSDAGIPMASLENGLEALEPAALGDVDLVFVSSRLARTSYMPFYDGRLGGKPVTGSRTAYLVLRFEPQRAPVYYGARVSLQDAAATSVSRLRRRLAGEDCPARPLSMGELRQFLAHTSASDHEQWSHMVSDGHHPLVDTTYAIDPASVNDVRLHEVWGNRADEVIVTFRRLRGAGWHGYVRLRTVTPPLSPPLSFLRSLSGQQAAAAAIGTPEPAQAPLVTVFEPLESLSHMFWPTGADGQIIASDDVGNALLLPLVPGPGRIVAARVDDALATQLVLRAAVCGAHVAILTERPQFWEHLVSPYVSVVEFSAEQTELPSGRQFLHVYDRLHPPTGAETAILALVNPDATAPAAGTGSDEADESEDPGSGQRQVHESGEPYEPAGDITIDQLGTMIAVTINGQTQWLEAHIDPAEVPHIPALWTTAPAGMNQ